MKFIAGNCMCSWYIGILIVGVKLYGGGYVYVMVMRCMRGDGYMYEDVVVVVVLPDPKTIIHLILRMTSLGHVNLRGFTFPNRRF